MGDKENSPGNKRYPVRKRNKVKYDEFEMSMEETPSAKKAIVVNDESSEDELKSSKDDVDFKEEEPEEEISEYEKLRLKNLEENRRIMMELGLLDPKKEERKKVVSTPTKPKKRQVQTPKNKEPTKRSLRLQRKTPEGRELPLDLFQDSPSESLFEVEEKTRLEEEFLPMDDNGKSCDFLESLKSSVSQSSSSSSEDSIDTLIKQMRNLELEKIKKVNTERVQSICIHPMENMLLVISGSKTGEIGLWNVTDGQSAQFNPHLRAANCVSVYQTDPTKIFSTSFDGTVRRADVEKSVFELVYQTDDKVNMCHITWHAHVDNHTLLVAHGTGEAGVVDLRTTKVQRWFRCHPRSIRTIHIHPTLPHYFLTASGIGECKIWDLRGSKKYEDEYLGEFSIPKNRRGLTSGFFSPDGTKVLTTCNDDFLRVHDVSDLAKPAELTRIIHNNHTGRWLSVFKAIWHTHSSDLIFIGSMLHPRRIQMFNSSGHLVREVEDEEHLTTVTPVIALHPSLPILVAGNSTGKVHVFSTPEISSQIVKYEEDSI